MIKTTYKTEIKNILQPLDPNLCLNLLTPPRLSYRATPTLLQGNPTLLQGDLGSPRGHHRVGLKQRQRLVRLSNIWQITEYLADYQIFCRLPNILQITEDSADYRIFARLPNICQITEYSPDYQIFAKYFAEYSSLFEPYHCVTWQNRGHPPGEQGSPCRRALVGSLYFGTYSGVGAKQCFNIYSKSMYICRYMPPRM